MSKKKNEPPLEYRMVFVQFIRRQRTRYNPSLAGLLELPPMFRNKVIKKWQTSHKRMNLPDLKLSDRPKRKR